MKSLLRNLLGLALLLHAANIALAGAPEDFSETTCRKNLSKIAAAVKAWQFVHESSPTNLAELYDAGLVQSLATFSCPLSGNAIAARGGIDASSDYTLAPLTNGLAPIVREKAPNHSSRLLAMTATGVVAIIMPATKNDDPDRRKENAVVTNGPPIVSSNRVAVVPPITPPSNSISVVVTDNPVVLPPGVVSNRIPVVVTNTVPVVYVAETLAQAIQLVTAGRYAEALPVIDRALAQEPLNKAALWNRGVARMWTGNLPGSVADLDALRALDPTNLELRRVRTVTALAASVDVPTARAVASELLRTQAGNAQFLLLAGQAEWALGNGAGAQQYFARAAAADPRIINATYEQAGQFLQAGVLQMAYLQYSTVVWADQSMAGGYYGVGMSAAMLGPAFRPQAIAALEQYLRFDPNSTYGLAAQKKLNEMRNGQ